MKLAQVNIKNRRATFDFDIIDTYVAGIVLTGTEIKSIRLGKAGLTDSFCYENNGEIWIKNMYIGEYFYGSYNNHSSRRDRKSHAEVPLQSLPPAGSPSLWTEAFALSFSKFRRPNQKPRTHHRRATRCIRAKA